jgi:hypothetical protein
MLLLPTSTTLTNTHQSTKHPHDATANQQLARSTNERIMASVMYQKDVVVTTHNAYSNWQLNTISIIDKRKF